MASIAKRTKRVVRNAAMSWRHGLIAHAPEWARTRFGGIASYLDMLFVDHGVFRMIYLNRHRLSEDAWRSAQPAPHQIRAMARAGVRTIINLRGERVCGSDWLERRTCRELGIRLIDFSLGSRAAPTKDQLHTARQLFSEVEYPIMFHCKSGADRAGLMSVLFRHFREGKPIAEARNELALKYGHIKQADTGVLDAVFEKYLEDTAENSKSFMEWVETDYRPEEIKSTFRVDGMANRIVNSVLRRE